jgi:hypothetical protein
MEFFWSKLKPSGIIQIVSNALLSGLKGAGMMALKRNARGDEERR